MKIKLNRPLVAVNSILMATRDFFEGMNTASIMGFCSYTFADNRSSSLVLLSSLLSTKWQSRCPRSGIHRLRSWAFCFNGKLYVVDILCKASVTCGYLSVFDNVIVGLPRIW